MEIKPPKVKFMETKKITEKTGRRSDRPVKKKPEKKESAYDLMMSLKDPKHLFNFKMNCLLRVFEIGSISKRSALEALASVLKMAIEENLDIAKLAELLREEHSVRSAKYVARTDIRRLEVITTDDLNRMIDLAMLKDSEIKTLPGKR